MHRLPSGSRDCLREEVNRLRATLEIAGLEPTGERCVRCSWVGDDVLKQCWPCKRIKELSEGLRELAGRYEALALEHQKCPG